MVLHFPEAKRSHQEGGKELPCLESRILSGQQLRPHWQCWKEPKCSLGIFCLQITSPFNWKYLVEAGNRERLRSLVEPPEVRLSLWFVSAGIQLCTIKLMESLVVFKVGQLPWI